MKTTVIFEPKRRISLKQWMKKHKVSSAVMSHNYAIKYAIEHEQNKFELSLI